MKNFFLNRSKFFTFFQEKYKINKNKIFHMILHLKIYFFLKKYKNAKILKIFYPLGQKIFSKLDIFLDIFIFSFFNKINYFTS